MQTVHGLAPENFARARRPSHHRGPGSCYNDAVGLRAGRSMTEENDKKILQKIKGTYGRIVVIVGTLLGFVLCTYFFTLGILIDGGHTFLLWCEIITTVLFIIGLFYLKPMALFITRILLSGNADSRRVLKGMTVADVEKAPQ